MYIKCSSTRENTTLPLSGVKNCKKTKRKGNAKVFLGAYDVVRNTDTIASPVTFESIRRPYEKRITTPYSPKNGQRSNNQLLPYR